MTNDIKIRTNRAKVATQLRPEAHKLLLRTIRQLNSIGIYDGSTMTAVYGRRLARVEAEAAAEAAAEAKRQRALFLAKAA